LVAARWHVANVFLTLPEPVHPSGTARCWLAGDRSKLLIPESFKLTDVTFPFCKSGIDDATSEITPIGLIAPPIVNFTLDFSFIIPRLGFGRLTSLPFLHGFVISATIKHTLDIRLVS
jgi:hypothetical protein